MTQRPAESAGTRPADHVHPEAIAAAKRAGVDLTDARPRALNSLGKLPGLVVTVCDQAHEELSVHDRWLHWSIPDPVSEGSRAAFDSTVVQLRDRISAFVGDQAAS